MQIILREFSKWRSLPCSGAALVSSTTLKMGTSISVQTASLPPDPTSGLVKKCKKALRSISAGWSAQSLSNVGCTLYRFLIGLHWDPKCASDFADKKGLYVFCVCTMLSSLRLKILRNCNCTFDPSEILQIGHDILNRFLVGTNRFV